MFNKIQAIRYASTEVYVITWNDTLAYARNLMMRHNISRLVVVEDKKPVGIVSQRDLLSAISKLDSDFEGRNLDEILIKDIASRNIKTLDTNASVKDACKLMNGQNIGSIVLTDNDKNLVGIFTKTDAIKAFTEYGSGKWKVIDIMEKVATTINRFQSLKKAIDVFVHDRADIIIVTDNKVPIGVISLKNILTYRVDLLLKSKSIKYTRAKGSIEESSFTEMGGKIKQQPLVEDLMTPLQNAVGENDDLVKAASLMLKFGVSGMPVVDNLGTLVGVVTKTNIVSLISKA
ncbi:MAG: CBS domain-containing protein [Thermoprotei archaeon]|jgi:CBS domain-containing protein